MLRGGLARQASILADVPANGSGNTSPGSPVDVEGVARPRKKLSFKEPEFFGYLKLKKPLSKNKQPPLIEHCVTPATESNLTDSLFDEDDEAFKAELESQAMRVVRTVGQAFEVCHKLSINAASDEKERGEIDRSNRESENLHRDDDYDDREEIGSEQPQPSPTSLHKDLSLLGDGEDVIPEQTPVSCLLRSHEVPVTTASASPVGQSPSGTVASECGGLLAGGELTALKHEIQLLRERLDQQNQQTRAAVAHARLLQDQLAAETAARIEAQTRTHQLLVQNKELLEHIGALVGHLREQERLSSGHLTGQSQVPGSANVPLQTPTIPDLSGLGQRPGGQNSPWELDPPSFPYCSYQPYPTESMLYPGNSSTVGLQGTNNCTEQLHFQTQLLERLHNISPYQLQRSPYTTPSPYAMGPSLLIPPNSRHSLTPFQNSSQFSPGSVSLRVSQANSFTSSPVMSQKMENYITPGFEINQTMHEANYTKTLPPDHRKSSADVRSKVRTVYDEIPPIVLDPPPQGRRNENPPKKEMQSSRNNVTIREENESQNQKAKEREKKLASVLRTPGPPPSRTTSARLPPRNDLMGQVKRTTWARHTTK